jgi:hypothetical protein
MYVMQCERCQFQSVRPGLLCKTCGCPRKRLVMIVSDQQDPIDGLPKLRRQFLTLLQKSLATLQEESLDLAVKARNGCATIKQLCLANGSRVHDEYDEDVRQAS